MIRVRKFPKKRGRVEGLALGHGGRVFYVCDDETVFAFSSSGTVTSVEQPKEALMAENDEDQLKRTNLSIARWEQERDKDSIKRLDGVLVSRSPLPSGVQVRRGKGGLHGWPRWFEPVRKAGIRGRHSGDHGRPRRCCRDGRDD